MFGIFEFVFIVRFPKLVFNYSYDSMRFFLLLLINCLCFIVLAQHKNPMNIQFQGKTEGKHYGYYNRTYRKIKIIFKIKNGNLDSVMTSYLKNGKVTRILRFNNGLFNGEQLEYDKKGRITSREVYKNDTLIEYQIFSYHKNNSVRDLQETFFFKDSLRINEFPNLKTFKNGDIQYSMHSLTKEIPNETTFKSFYKSGKLFVILVCRNGTYTGLQTTYYEDGTIWSISSFLDNKLNGKYKTHFPNGQLKIESFYKNGLLDGEYKEYNDKGVLIKTYNYINGVKQKP